MVLIVIYSYKWEYYEFQMIKGGWDVSDDQKRAPDHLHTTYKYSDHI